MIKNDKKIIIKLDYFSKNTFVKQYEILKPYFKNTEYICIQNSEYYLTLSTTPCQAHLGDKHIY